MQMFEVAFSRRMCCSRVASVSTKPRLPLRSVVWPTRRPGICRTYSRRGDHPAIGAAEAERHTERLRFHGDDVSRSAAVRQFPTKPLPRLRPPASRLCGGRSRATASTSSIVPKKFGDCIRTHAVSAVIAVSSSFEIDAAVVAESDGRERHSLMKGVSREHFAILRMHAACDGDRTTTREANSHHYCLGSGG